MTLPFYFPPYELTVFIALMAMGGIVSLIRVLIIVRKGSWS